MNEPLHFLSSAHAHAHRQQEISRLFCFYILPVYEASHLTISLYCVHHPPLCAGQLSKLEKMYHSLKDCKLQLLEYTRLHQESCPWLMLLPSDDVLQFICHGSDPIFLSANINKILPPAESLLLSECAQEVKVSGIISKDGDTLTLLEVYFWLAGTHM